jgi:hypothetical protein
MKVDADDLAGLRRSDDAKNLDPCSAGGILGKGWPAMNSDGNLASAAESGKGSALGRDREARVGVVKKGDSTEGLDITFANFDSKRALARGGTKILRIEALADPIGFAESIETGGREQNRVDLALFEFAQARVDVASEFDRLNVAAQRFQLRAAARAAGAYASAARQLSEARLLDGDKNVTRVGSGRHCRKYETVGELGGKIFERMNREIDSASGERIFNFFGEHALGADLGKGDFLQAVAGGFDDFDFDLMALDAQEFGDMIGLPEGELRPATADTQFHRRALGVFGIEYVACCIYKSVS